MGDRTGLEMIRTLQYHAIHQTIDVYMECKIERLLKDGDRVCGAFGYWRNTGKFVLFKAKAIVLASGGIGKAWKYTSNSWEYTGDGQSLAYWAGADLIDMEFVQFHPTGMVWPPSVRGILVTEGVRGDGGTLKNTEGDRFMFNYIPEFFKGETADNQEEADRWYVDKKNNRRTPDLLPRDEVARAINSEVKAGRGTPHGGVFLDIASRRPADYIRKRLPSMYHQFKELAGVDITKGPMEVGPTMHYVMGGVRVDADSTAATVPGLFAAGEVAGGLHGSNRLGGNSPRRPARVRPPRGPARRALLQEPGRPAHGGHGPGRVHRPRRCSSPSRARAARTRTRSRPTCRTRCTTWSASSESSRSSRTR